MTPPTASVECPQWLVSTAAASAPISTGYPSAVPVPCASTTDSVKQQTLHALHGGVAAAHVHWAQSNLPSVHPAALRSQARRHGASARSQPAVLKYCTPHHGKTRLLDCQMCATVPTLTSYQQFAMFMLFDGSRSRFTPDARCSSHSPDTNARLAEWHATSAAEHAVSNEAQGP